MANYSDVRKKYAGLADAARMYAMCAEQLLDRIVKDESLDPELEPLVRAMMFARDNMSVKLKCAPTNVEQIDLELAEYRYNKALEEGRVLENDRKRPLELVR